MRSVVVMMSRRAIAAATIVILAAGCSPRGDQPPPRGLFGVGDGRSLFLDCQGRGSPPVLIIPGKGSYAEAWNVIVPPDDPIRSSSYDMIEHARLGPSPEAVQPRLARARLVCAYDRPDTRPDGPDRSTPIAQPHDLGRDVEDIVALIGAAGLTGPFVVVAHSYGGLIADLLARTHPDLVAALVMVDPVSEFLPRVGSPAQNAAFDRDGRLPAIPDGEAVLFDDAFARVQRAPPLPKVPAAVLSSGRFFAPQMLTPENYTQSQIHRANEMLAAALGTTNSVIADSGHNVMLYDPAAVVDTVESVVARLG